MTIKMFTHDFTKSLLFYLVFFYILAIPGFLLAQTTYIFNATGVQDSWTDVSKWSPSYPGTTIAAEDAAVIVGTEGSSCLLTNDLTIHGFLEIMKDIYLNTNVSITVNGVMNLSLTNLYASGTNSFNNYGTINNTGNFQAGNCHNYGIINNDAVIAMNSTNTLWNHGSATVNSSGTILLQQTSTITNDGTFISTGLIKLDQNSRSITNNLGATFNVSGSLELVNSGGVNAFFTNQGTLVYGVLSLKGNISLPNDYTNQVGGLVSPGNSAGIIAISGNYVNNGTLKIELKHAPLTLNDDPFANNDLLLIAGTASLGGTLNVSLIEGFVPKVGDQWRILNAATSTGAFATVQFPTGKTWNLIYNDATGDVILTVTHVIPVELVRFEGKKENNKTVLTWQTAQETHISHFEVEKSFDGHSFEPIGILKAEQKPSNYQFLDANPSSNLVYYRLKIYDLDGKTELSKTISIHFPSSISIKMAPSVFSDILNIKSENEGFSTIKIVNAVGQIVFSSVLESNLTIPTSSWQKGVYIVQIKTGNNDFSEKIIKLQ